MKKKLYFTNAAPPWKSINSPNTYVSFTYDTETKELKLVDSFADDVKEIVIGTGENQDQTNIDTFDIEKNTSEDFDSILTTYIKSNYYPTDVAWFETQLELNDDCQLDVLSSVEDFKKSIKTIRNVFRVITTETIPTGMEEQIIQTPAVIFQDLTVNEDGSITKSEPEVHRPAIWTDDVPLNGWDLPITFADAFEALKNQTEIEVPHTRFMTLRKHLAPQDPNQPIWHPVYVCGKALVFVDAVDGTVMDHLPFAENSLLETPNPNNVEEFGPTEPEE